MDNEAKWTQITVSYPEPLFKPGDRVRIENEPEWVGLWVKYDRQVAAVLDCRDSIHFEVDAHGDMHHKFVTWTYTLQLPGGQVEYFDSRANGVKLVLVE